MNGDKGKSDEARHAGSALRSHALEPGESILDAIERVTGRASQILLRDVPGELSPIVKMQAREGDEAAEDDARYQFLGELARGGVGVVLKGRDRDLGREVAVKMLRPRFAKDADVAERLVEEAQITGQLQNPGIVPVYDLGLQPDGRPYFTMKLVKGRTLSALLEDRESPADRRRSFLSIFEHVCQTLAYAHARDVIHRDLKPSNIMIGAFGEVQVVDWGFAKVLGLERQGRPPPQPDLSVIATVRSGEEGSQSIAGSVMGTPAYMPPEQALGQIDKLDERADVFALGAILCEILTGKPPYVGDPGDLLVLAAQARLDDAYARLDACGAHRELTSLAKHCLQPARSVRPANASLLVEALTEHLSGVEARVRQAELEAAEARAKEKEERLRLEREKAQATWERSARRRFVVLAATLLLAILLAGGGYFLAERDRKSRVERTDIAVRAAIGEAKFFEGQRKWSKAVAAAERATQLARSGESTGSTHERADALLGHLQARKRASDAAAAQAETDRRVLDRLAEIRARWYATPDAAADDAFAAAFRDYGIDVVALAPEAAAKAIRATDIAVELAANLDAWAWARRGYASEPGTDWRRLVEIARSADPDPWRNRVRSAVKVQDLEGLALATGIDDVEPTTLVLLGRALLASGKTQTATALLRRAYQRHPSNYSVLALLAAALQRTTPSSWSEATRFLTAAYALRPHSHALRNNLSLALVYAGELDDAITALTEGSVGDLDALGYRRLGSAYARKGDRAAALAAFREAIRLAPQSAATHNEFGAVLSDAFQDHETAIASLREALRLEPDYPEALLNLGRTYARHGDLARALESFEEALRLRPDYAEALIGMGVALARAHRHHDAIDSLLKAAKIEGAPKVLYYHLGVSYQGTGRPSAAIGAFGKAIEHSVETVRARTARAAACRVVGNWKFAARELVEVIKLSPGFAPAYIELGETEFRNGLFEQGVQRVRHGHGLDPTPATLERLNRLERLLELADSLDAVVKGEREPAQGERRDLAVLAFHRRHYASAARLFGGVEHADGERRVPAAAAALAGTGKGADTLADAGARARWRRQALRWLRADLALRRKQLGDTAVHVSVAAFRELGLWQDSWHLATVRETALNALPESERGDWRAFWHEVNTLLATGGAKGR